MAVEQIATEMATHSIWQPENADLKEATKAIDQSLVGTEGMYSARIHALRNIHRTFG